MDNITRALDRGIALMESKNATIEGIWFNPEQLKEYNQFISKMVQGREVDDFNCTSYRGYTVEQSENIPIDSLKFQGKQGFHLLQHWEDIVLKPIPKAGTIDQQNLLEVNKDYEWVLRIIRSCITLEQLEFCDNAIKLFKTRHPQHANMGDVLQEVLAAKRRDMIEQNKKQGI